MYVYMRPVEIQPMVYESISIYVHIKNKYEQIARGHPGGPYRATHWAVTGIVAMQRPQGFISFNNLHAAH